MSEVTRVGGLSRIPMIVLLVVIFGSAVIIIGEWWFSEGEPLATSGMLIESAKGSRLAGEGSGYQHGARARALLRASDGGSRTLAEFYQGRAYLGGPPWIPHEVEGNMELGGRQCLTCHQEGGWVPKWNAYTPITPHPELLNCRQCHNPATGSGGLSANSFSADTPPALKQNPLPDGPPPMPHSLQLRENCLSCHAGPGAVRELRTTHPERTNCRQCHAQGAGTEVWFRTAVRDAEETE